MKWLYDIFNVYWMPSSIFSSSIPSPQKKQTSKGVWYKSVCSFDTGIIVVGYTIGFILVVTMVSVIVLMVV